MVIACHLIWTAYGWWLPNDPRGSLSRFIASDVIAQLGALHFGRKTLQPASRVVRAFYDEAPDKRMHALLKFSPRELNAIAQSTADVITREKYTCYAYANMDDHQHIVIRKHRDRAEEMIEKLQMSARDVVIAEGQRDADHPVWGGHGYKVFLIPPTASGARSSTSTTIPSNRFVRARTIHS